MKPETGGHAKQKQITDLTRHEINMIYSLVRVGNWPDSEIGRVYKLAETDVRKVFNNYEELLATVEQNPCGQEQLRQDPSPERIEKPRKRRRDARFAIAADRQAAYRARLMEKRHADMQQPPPSSDTDSPSPADSDLIRSGAPVPVADTDSPCADAELLT
jgi:hypothetical protein